MGKERWEKELVISNGYFRKPELEKVNEFTGNKSITDDTLLAQHLKEMSYFCI